MNGKRFKNTITVSGMLMLLVLLLSLQLTGCNGEIGMEAACCPNITAATVSDPWVCPANCPGGGRTRVTYKVEFWKASEHCPPPNKVKISIKNLTDNVNLSPLIIKNPGTGIYEGTADIIITKDTKFELTVTGGDELCGSASGKFQVDVVNAGDFHKLCYSGPLAWPGEHTGYEPFGPGVLIDYIENLDSLKIRVKKEHSTDTLPPYYSPGKGLSGLAANGNWAIGLTNETDYGIYNSRPKDAQKLCVNVYLQCKCK